MFRFNSRTQSDYLTHSDYKLRGKWVWNIKDRLREFKAVVDYYSGTKSSKDLQITQVVVVVVE